MFRQLTDIYDSWHSVIGMIEYFGDDPGNFSQVAGPGAWNDPDQVHLKSFCPSSPFCLDIKCINYSFPGGNW